MMSVQSAISFKKDEWAGVMADINACDEPKLVTEFVNSAYKVETDDRIVLRWDEKVDLSGESYDVEVREFLAIADKHGGERLVIDQSDEFGDTHVFDDRQGCDPNIDWQAAEIIIPSEELFLAEHERLLPKLIKLAVDAGVTREALLNVFNESLNYRRDKSEVLDAYLKKADVNLEEEMDIPF